MHDLKQSTCCIRLTLCEVKVAGNDEPQPLPTRMLSLNTSGA